MGVAIRQQKGAFSEPDLPDADSPPYRLAARTEVAA
jgi:hypothetical protein